MTQTKKCTMTMIMNKRIILLNSIETKVYSLCRVCMVYALEFGSICFFDRLFPILFSCRCFDFFNDTQCHSYDPRDDKINV